MAQKQLNDPPPVLEGSSFSDQTNELYQFYGHPKKLTLAQGQFLLERRLEELTTNVLGVDIILVPAFKESAQIRNPGITIIWTTVKVTSALLTFNLSFRAEILG